MSGECAHLFVYGTLMSTAGHPMGARLAREARLVGPATIAGRLFDLGRYPALVEAGADGEVVHGEVYRLGTVASFRWLDAYEGIAPGAHGRNDYERVVRPVRLATGETLTAHVYLYRKNPGRARPLPGGRWQTQCSPG